MISGGFDDELCVAVDDDDDDASSETSSHLFLRFLLTVVCWRLLSFLALNPFNNSLYLINTGCDSSNRNLHLKRDLHKITISFI